MKNIVVWLIIFLAIHGLADIIQEFSNLETGWCYLASFIIVIMISNLAQTKEKE